MASKIRPIAIYYEHQEWFRPLFAELDRRGTPYVRLDASRHSYDATRADGREFGLVFNRMSPSAYLRGRGHTILYTLSYLAHLEHLGVRVINGVSAFRMETSKALQLSLLGSLGLPFPAARVINHADEAPAAAEGLRFPVVVKPNIGGSGAGILRFDGPDDLVKAAEEGRLELGLDQTALVQEFIPARSGHITRVEVLNGRYLYAINVYSSGESFNLCPADICHMPRQRMRAEGTTPPRDVIADVERITQAAGIEVGGVEYVFDSRDGRRYYYDINALSNFVADAPRVIGFDPFTQLVDFLEEAIVPSSGVRVPASGARSSSLLDVPVRRSETENAQPRRL